MAISFYRLQSSILLVALLFHQQLWSFAAPSRILIQPADSHHEPNPNPNLNSNPNPNPNPSVNSHLNVLDIQSATSSAAPQSPSTGPFASDDPNESFFSKFQSETPESIRGPLGAPILGPSNIPLQKQNPDLLAPPSTDAGQFSNAKWSFDLSKMRLLEGGYVRVQNTDNMRPLWPFL